MEADHAKVMNVVALSVRNRLLEFTNHLRENIDKGDDPRLKAMLETTAEVRQGLRKAFKDYEQKKRKCLAYLTAFHG
jgi:hypothetical protein